MAELNQIKDRIRETAGRRKNVRLSEIVWVVNQLSRAGYEVSSRNNGHQTLFRVANRRFGVCCHNPGERQVKPCYVDEFIDAMTDLDFTMTKPSKDVTYYLSLPYTIRLRRDDVGDVVARIEELPGCISHGSDESEALSNLRDMQTLWLEDSIASGQSIPEPEADEPLPSGKWVQRVPRSLHRRLVQMAKAEGVSLNQLVTSMLSERLSTRAVERTMEQLIANHLTSKPEPFQHYWDKGAWLPGEWHIDVKNMVSFHSAMAKVIPTIVELKVPHASQKLENEGYFLAGCER